VVSRQVCNFTFDTYTHFRGGDKPHFRVRIQGEEKTFDLTPSELDSPLRFMHKALGAYGEKGFTIFGNRDQWREFRLSQFTELGNTVDMPDEGTWGEVVKEIIVGLLASAPSADTLEEVRAGQPFHKDDRIYFKWNAVYQQVSMRLKVIVAPQTVALALIELGGTRSTLGVRDSKGERRRERRMWSLPRAVVQQWEDARDTS